MKSVRQLGKEVGQWSQANFGQNLTDLHPVVVRAGTVDTLQYGMAALDSLCSLLGLGEEIGELFADAEDEDAVRDAVGDICIYALDYAYRESMVIPPKWLQATPNQQHQYGDPLACAVAAYGRLLRCHLKRYQKIRNMDNPATFTATRDEAFRDLLHAMADYVVSMWPKMSLLMLANQTWANVVAKRDWKAAPQDGGGHTHAKAPSTPQDAGDGGFTGNGADVPVVAAQAALGAEDWHPERTAPADKGLHLDAVDKLLDRVQASLGTISDQLDGLRHTLGNALGRKPVAPASSGPEPDAYADLDDLHDTDLYDEELDG